MYKLLALDIDDTLLNSERELSGANKEAIERAARSGVTITIATGRAYVSAQKICQMMGLAHIPVISFGGAQIVQYPTGESLYGNVLKPELVREAIDFGLRKGVHVQAYDGDVIIVQEENKLSRLYESRVGYSARQGDLLHGEFTRSAKVLYIASEEEMPELLESARRHFGARARVVQSYKCYIEIYPATVDKATALCWLAEHLEIKREEIIAMGDNGIDAPMLRWAGLGVAVSNATDEAKEAADVIGPSSDENAVAQIIDTYIL